MHQVGCRLVLDVLEPSAIALQVAPAGTSGAIATERLEITDPAGRPPVSVVEVGVAHAGRIHVVTADPGTITVDYDATFTAWDPIDPNGELPPGWDTGAEAIEGLRQSRYCPSDALEGYVHVEFGNRDAPAYDRALEIASWVFERLHYVSGASDALDTAVDTLVSGSGVCRDFAHLTIALCRAWGVPARLAAVYAPGLDPMDFHAVTEVLTATGWVVLDATRLAPRPTLARIATGRDAADTAFATTLRGDVELLGAEIHASTDEALPIDDHVGPVRLA
jgi:transglutaminase-like putative cysteine protease